MKRNMTELKWRHDIALILDHPSVYMGGPSQVNLKRADKILEYLANQCEFINQSSNKGGSASHVSHGGATLQIIGASDVDPRSDVVEQGKGNV